MLVMSGAVAYSGRRCCVGSHVDASPDAGQRLVAFDRRHQVIGIVTDVADVGRHRRREQVFSEHVPLLGELRAQVRVPCAHLARRLVERPQLRKTRRQRARTGRRVVIDLRFEEVRWVERQPKVGSRPLHVLSDPVAATEDPAIAATVGEPEPRLEALHVRLVKRPALAVAVLSQDLLTGAQAEIGLTVVLLDDGLRVRPPHAEVERERRA